MTAPTIQDWDEVLAAWTDPRFSTVVVGAAMAIAAGHRVEPSYLEDDLPVRWMVRHIRRSIHSPEVIEAAARRLRDDPDDPDVRAFVRGLARAAIDHFLERRPRADQAQGGQVGVSGEPIEPSGYRADSAHSRVSATFGTATASGAAGEVPSSRPAPAAPGGTTTGTERESNAGASDPAAGPSAPPHDP